MSRRRPQSTSPSPFGSGSSTSSPATTHTSGVDLSSASTHALNTQVKTSDEVELDAFPGTSREELISLGLDPDEYREEPFDWDSAPDPFEEPPVRRVVRPPCPRKTLAMAVFLTMVGVVFGFTGLGLFLEKGMSDAMPFFIIGGIGFIPGFYHLVLLLRAWLGHRGYSYDMVPSYDD